MKNGKHGNKISNSGSFKSEAPMLIKGDTGGTVKKAGPSGDLRNGKK